MPSVRRSRASPPGCGETDNLRRRFIPACAGNAPDMGRAIVRGGSIAARNRTRALRRPAAARNAPRPPSHPMTRKSVETTCSVNASVDIRFTHSSREASAGALIRKRAILGHSCPIIRRWIAPQIWMRHSNVYLSIRHGDSRLARCLAPGRFLGYSRRASGSNDRPIRTVE